MRARHVPMLSDRGVDRARPSRAQEPVMHAKRVQRADSVTRTTRQPLRMLSRPQGRRDVECPVTNLGKTDFC